MRKLVWSGAALVAMLSLVACGPTSSPTPSTSSAAPTTTSAPSESASPTPSPTDTEPVYAFNGDCTNAFSNIELATAFDHAMTDLGVNWSIGQEEALGGVKCTWWADDMYLGAVVVLTALPAAAAPDSVVDAAQCVENNCEATMLTSQGWYSMVTFGSLTSDDPAIIQGLLTQAAERGDALPQPVVPQATASTWARPPIACADLAELLTPPDGSPITLVVENMADSSLLAPLYATLGNFCTFSMPSSDPESLGVELMFSVTVVPGGAVAFDDGVIRGKGVPVQIANGEAAEVVMPFVAEGNMGIFATDGTNTVAVAAPHELAPTEFTWVAEQLIDALAP